MKNLAAWNFTLQNLGFIAFQGEHIPLFPISNSLNEAWIRFVWENDVSISCNDLSQSKSFYATNETWQLSLMAGSQLLLDWDQ